MSKINDYLEYRKYKPEYQNWKNNRNLQTAKKLEYLKTNPIDDKQKDDDIKRAKIILNAVNTMDEYSQSRAEDMEVYIQGIIKPIADVVVNLSTLIAIGWVALSKNAQKALSEVIQGNFKNARKLIAPLAIFIVPSIILSVFTSFWGAKKEIQASREGRADAIENDLQSENQFALLTDEQEAEVEKIANTIKVSKKEKSKAISATKGLGVIESFKTIFKKEKEDKSLAKPKIDLSAKLTPEEILEAKKDKELIQAIVEKIDITSQDYAENAELITKVAMVLGLAGGGVVSSLAGKISKLLKVPIKYSQPIKLITNYAIMFSTAIIAAKIDKQASRVGRFRAKKELLNNPQVLYYVDNDKLKNVDANIDTSKKANFFQTFIQLIKDNREYNKYVKENNAKDIQLRKAKNQIDISSQQKARAQQLQKNVFNMFNILDDKSQTYSEATEALGDLVSQMVSNFIFAPLLLLTMFKETTKMIETKEDYKPSAWIKIASTFIIPILMNVIVTKEQKNASRVANMQAIKELDDYRYFANDKKDNNSQKLDSNKIFEKFLK